MTEDTSWLEEGAFSVPSEAARRLNVIDETAIAWAKAGYIRYLTSDNPRRYLLCDDDIDELAELLRGVKHPNVLIIRMLKDRPRES